MQRLLITALACLISLSIFSQEETRLALVIGNADYTEGELKNPVNDALLVARTLDSLDFEVILDTNISDKPSFINTIRNFGNKRANYDVAFVYYAGHGIQIGAENYLLPTEESFNSEFDVIDFGVSVNNIMRYLNRYTDKVNILVLDACRNNPFEHKWNTNRSLTEGKGLAKIPPPTGSLIAFSTDVGSTAADGDGDNSIYCTSLCKSILLENVSLDQVFRNVRNEVLEKTNAKQRPVEESQLVGETFYFNYKEDTKIVSLAEEIDNAFQLLNEYEDYINSIDMRVIHKQDEKNKISVELTDFFKSTANFSKNKNTELYLLSLFGLMRTGISAYNHLINTNNSTEGNNDYKFFLNSLSDDVYILYREIANMSDDDIFSVTKEHLSISVEEFKLRVSIAYIVYATATEGQGNEFNYDEYIEVISDLHCYSTDDKTLTLLIPHLVNVALTYGYIQLEDLICISNNSNSYTKLFKSVLEISNQIDDNEKEELLNIIKVAVSFNELYESFTSSNFPTSNEFDTSFGLFYISYDRVECLMFSNYAYLLSEINFESIFNLDESKHKRQIIDFFQNELEKINTIAFSISESYFPAFLEANSNFRVYENDLYNQLFTNLVALNNNYYLISDENEYQYHFLLFSNFQARHNKTLKEIMYSYGEAFDLSEIQTENFADFYRNLELFALRNVYTGASSYSADFGHHDVSDFINTSSLILNDYYDNLIINNAKRDTVDVNKIIDFVYFKTRYCFYENLEHENFQANCYGELAALLIDLDFNRVYDETYYESEEIEKFWDNWYSNRSLTFLDNIYGDDNAKFVFDSLNFENTKLNNILEYQNKKWSGSNNRYSFFYLSDIIKTQIQINKIDSNYIYFINDNLIKLTDSYIGLINLRLELMEGDDETDYVSYIINDTKKIFDKTVENIIVDNNIKSEYKRLMLEGLSYKLNQFSEDVSLISKYQNIKEIIQLNTAILNIKINMLIKQNISQTIELINSVKDLLEVM